MFFQDGRNRAVFALLLLCFSLMECIFFLYAADAMYSPAYTAVLDVLSVSIIACLCFFLDFKRKMNPVFLGAGALLLAVFVQLCRSYFELGPEEGFYAIVSWTFWKQFLLRLLLFETAVLGTGLMLLRLDEKNPAVLLFPLLTVLAGFLLFGESVLYTLLLVSYFALVFLWVRNLEGGVIRLGLGASLISVFIFILATVLLFVYREGIILTQEACSFPVLFLIFVALIFAFARKRFGLHASAYLAAHLMAGYVLARIRGDIPSELLFGIIPFGLILITSVLINCFIKPRKKEANQ